MAVPELINKAAYERWVHSGRGSGLIAGVPEIFVWYREQDPDILSPDELRLRHEYMRGQLIELLTRKGVAQIDRGSERWGNFWAKYGILPALKRYGERKIDEAHFYLYRSQLTPDQITMGQSEVSKLNPVSVEVMSIGNLSPAEAGRILVKVPDIKASRGYLVLYPERAVLRVDGPDSNCILRQGFPIDYRQFGELVNELSQMQQAA